MMTKAEIQERIEIEWYNIDKRKNTVLLANYQLASSINQSSSS